MFRTFMLIVSFLLFSATPVMGQGIDIIAKGTFTIAAGEADSTRVDLRNIVADFTKSVHVTGDTLGGIAVARAIVIDTVGALTISTFYDTAGQAWFGGGDSILINFYKADYLDGSYRLDATPTPIRNTSTVGLQFSMVSS